MMRMIPAGRSLTYYVLLSWVIPGAAAAIVCLSVFTGVSLLQYRAEKNSKAAQLLDNSSLIARRVSAELLIGQRGAPDAVMRDLRESYDLKSVVLTSARPSCLSGNQESCSIFRNRTILVYRKAPLISDRYVEISVDSPKIADYFKLSNLLWTTFPIALMFGVGLLFQRLILRRFFLVPVQTLVETSIGDREARPYWPREIREISDKLYKSFEERDAAIFSQMTRGVIHDLRTLLQAPMAATELSAESVNDLGRRGRRLENLESICQQQLPKMKEIIDTTLDGSRQVTIHPRQAGVDFAVNGARRTLEPLLRRTGVTFSLDPIPQGCDFMHDPIQLERALTNLAKNGIEAAVVETSRVPQVAVRIVRDEKSIRIDVEDSGPGLRISPDRVFRPLKSTKAHGSGLGLVVTRNIVSAHGGSLVPGQSRSLGGAKFSVVLPLGRESV